MTEPRLGSKVRDYLLIERLAATGVAATYRATGPSGDVALKLYDGAGVPEPDATLAVQRELDHPAVARLVDAGELDDGGLFLATEWIDGTPLSALVARRASWDSIRRIVGAIGSGLGALHARGVVHRDLKPSDVIVPVRHACAAVIVDASPTLRDGVAEPPVGIVHATAPYAAPERAAGLPVDGRADLYALGVIMFQLLTGRFPDEGERDPELHKMPPVAQALCAWLLEPDRDARLPNAHVLAVTIGATASELGAMSGATVEARTPA
ncbi:MAG TPA: serine/threonine-protein kinase [Kofleriaceae bacterium]|jgi:serine/threonine protein kinase